MTTFTLASANETATREPSARSVSRMKPLTAWVAGWHPIWAVTIFVFIGLVIHEIAYALTSAADYPLTVLAGHTRVFAVSHGGLDALAVGALAVTVLLAIDWARPSR